MNTDAVGVVAPSAIEIGEWSKLDPDGVEFGILLRLLIPGGLMIRVGGAELHLTDALTLEIELGPLAALELARRLHAQLG